ncbi:MAG: hypothetical protein ACRDLB_13730 [Actinomycetota bacterium]
MTRFVETLEAGDTGCANKRQTVFPGVGEFPLLAREARPAEVDRGEGNEAGRPARRVAAVVAATVRDAHARATLAFRGPGRIRGHGLRGGRVVSRYLGDFGLDWLIELKRVRFALDVVVSGTIDSAADGRLEAELRVSGPADGRLTIRSRSYPSTGMLTLRGRLNGRRAALLAPQL